MKELIILGKGPSRAFCPFDAEVWGVNQVCEMIPHEECKRITKLFAFDDLPLMIEGMKATGIPIYSWQDFADKEYPYDEIVSRFRDYFTNTITYMIALAVYEGYEKLRLYGVDQRVETEYANEKGGVEFWLGVAIGQGIKVEISQGSSLFKTKTGRRYGE